MRIYNQLYILSKNDIIEYAKAYCTTLLQKWCKPNSCNNWLCQFSTIFFYTVARFTTECVSYSASQKQTHFLVTDPTLCVESALVVLRRLGNFATVDTFVCHFGSKYSPKQQAELLPFSQKQGCPFENSFGVTFIVN